MYTVYVYSKSDNEHIHTMGVFPKNVFRKQGIFLRVDIDDPELVLSETAHNQFASYTIFNF